MIIHDRRTEVEQSTHRTIMVALDKQNLVQIQETGKKAHVAWACRPEDGSLVLAGLRNRFGSWRDVRVVREGSLTNIKSRHADHMLVVAVQPWHPFLQQHLED